MRFILLKDINVMGCIHKAGEAYIIDSTDRLHDDIIEWYVGHGQYWPLKLGEDVSVMSTLDVVTKVLNEQTIKGALSYFQKESASLLDVNRLNIENTVNGYLLTYTI
jgi:hypothetical protein